MGRVAACKRAVLGGLEIARQDGHGAVRHASLSGAARHLILGDDAPQRPADLTRHHAIRYRLPGGPLLPWRLSTGTSINGTSINGTLRTGTPAGTGTLGTWTLGTWTLGTRTLRTGTPGTGTRQFTVEPVTRLILSVNALDTGVRYARSGMGMIATFRTWLEADFTAGTLVPVLPGFWPYQDGPRLYYPSRFTSAPLRAFIGLCRGSV